jgi:hypothetical protein
MGPGLELRDAPGRRPSVGVDLRAGNAELQQAFERSIE